MIKIVTLSLFALCSFGLLFCQRSSAAEPTAVLPKKNQVLDMHCHVAGIGDLEECDVQIAEEAKVLMLLAHLGK